MRCFVGLLVHPVKTPSRAEVKRLLSSTRGRWFGNTWSASGSGTPRPGSGTSKILEEIQARALHPVALKNTWIEISDAGAVAAEFANLQLTNRVAPC